MTSKEGPLSEKTLQRRLDAGLGIAGGARGSLTKALATPGTSSASLLHLEMTKLALMIRRNERLLQQAKERDETMATQDEESSSSLEEMRKALETAKSQHDCWQTYEGLAAAIVQKHVISETQLNADIAEIDAKYAKTKEQLESARTTSKTRAAQCHLLQQCVQDLQQSVDEDRILKEDQNKKPEAESSPPEDTDVVMKDDSDDEEGELYGDLDNHL